MLVFGASKLRRAAKIERLTKSLAETELAVLRQVCCSWLYMCRKSGGVWTSSLIRLCLRLRVCVCVVR